MIKSYAELVTLLSASFARYANQVQNGATQPYMELLTTDKVELILTVTDQGGINLKPFVQEAIAKPKEEEAPIETISVPDETPPTVEIEEEKPKPRRKK